MIKDLIENISTKLGTISEVQLILLENYCDLSILSPPRPIQFKKANSYSFTILFSIYFNNYMNFLLMYLDHALFQINN